MKRLAIIIAVLAAIFVGNRIVRASYQCAFPIFSHTVACLANDVLTGEDL